MFYKKLFKTSFRDIPISYTEIKGELLLYDFKNYENFIANRIYQLRNQKNVTAREMRLAIGQHKGYITQIENRQNLPSIQGLLYICEYFNITPEEFFADSTNPIKSKEIYADLKDLSSDQLDTILKIAKAFKALNQNSIQ